MKSAVIVPVPPNIWNDALGLGAIGFVLVAALPLAAAHRPERGYASHAPDAVPPVLNPSGAPTRSPPRRRVGPEPYPTTPGPPPPPPGTLPQCLAVFLEVALS